MPETTVDEDSDPRWPEGEIWSSRKRPIQTVALDTRGPKRPAEVNLEAGDSAIALHGSQGVVGARRWSREHKIEVATPNLSKQIQDDADDLVHARAYHHGY